MRDLTYWLAAKAFVWQCWLEDRVESFAERLADRFIR